MGFFTKGAVGGFLGKKKGFFGGTKGTKVEISWNLGDASKDNDNTTDGINCRVQNQDYKAEIKVKV
jgi:hypothetical protein